MKMARQKVSFGIINCNRLFYLKSCVESLAECTKDYFHKEIIIVDNASIEDGTSEYLLELENRGYRVIRHKTRDPSNEFAKAMNSIVEIYTGDYLCILQGDLQFTLSSGWLAHYVDFYEKNKSNIGCMGLDAQRRVTNESHTPYGVDEKENREYRFLIDLKRNPISGAGDALYSREIIDLISPWSSQNKSHEGGEDSETKMIKKSHSIIEKNSLNLYFAMPVIPPAAAIYTDARGTNARIRGNKRYGDYWAPKEDFRYYKIHDYDEMISRQDEESGIPLPIETMAIPIGFSAPIDSNGSWKKNPIRPESCEPSDYVCIGDSSTDIDDHTVVSLDDTYIEKWLES